MPTHKDKDIYRNKYKNSTGSFWHSKMLNKSSQLFVLDSVILQKVHALSFSSFLQKKMIMKEILQYLFTLNEKLQN